MRIMLVLDHHVYFKSITGFELKNAYSIVS